MTRVSALPFMLGMAGAMALFAAWLPMAIRESRRPYHWRETPPPEPAPREALPPRLVALRPKVVDLHVVEPQREPPRRHAATPRIAVVVLAFTVWSLWSLRNHVDQR
jgi:hypothetical protein